MDRKKHIGVDSFFADRKRLLDAYDRAKTQSSEDSVKIDHGFVAEDLVRSLLESFLPRRFGVCKGYIITHSLEYSGDLEEWDVIIYDALESPVLFSRQTTDGAARGERRAIPVEYVRGVLEVKASLNPQSAKLVAKKLSKLRHFIGTDEVTEYPRFLCDPFVSAAVFFETQVRNLSEYRKALDNLCVLYQKKPKVPFMGGIILRSKTNASHSGYLELTTSEQPILIADVHEMSNSFEYTDSKFGIFGVSLGE